MRMSVTLLIKYVIDNISMKEGNTPWHLLPATNLDSSLQ